MKNLFNTFVYGKKPYTSGYVIIQQFYKYVTTAAKQISYATTATRRL